MELRDYIALLRRSWILIVSLALVGLLGGGSAALLVKPTYMSETQLFVAIQNSGTVQELQQGNTFSQARVQSYVKTAVTPAVLQPVIDSLGLTATAEELGKRISATSDLNTVLITITVEDGSAVQAAAIAQAVANSLIRTVDELERPDKTSASPVRLSVVTPAVVPAAAASPNTKMSLLLGLVSGFAVGFLGAVFRKFLDNRVRGEADVRKITDSPILGAIALEADAKGKPLISQVPSQSPRAESFRQLRTNLQFANIGQRTSAVLVTSSLPGEGKTTTATNMALTLAQSGQSVVLVDADLRRPMVAEYLGLDRNAGLTTVLVGDAELNEMLQPWGADNLFVLTSGRIPPNPSELLGSEAMGQLIRQLSETFDAVVIDSPPLLPVTDAAVLAQQVGGVILVIDTQRTRQASVFKSLHSLSLVSANLMGVVMNRLPLKGPDAYGYGYYGYSSHPESNKIARPANTEGQGFGPRSTDGEYPELQESARRATKFPGTRTSSH
ncbi:polysaccharide biosynthesis tyrosine autokinase [Pseudarthrobacter psychrotolerans]|uniref:non-specific protein-tyrosine kinase n=1 Tax=Pseudarthrobacter psychrotolerans TaxID=2697569 RepID=A0A6P1NP34_9MICC|nr:polysaccharide biosynthesis tyrosine autokinase [Pseudarthrobacter psychrotolerans]QHK20170.1 polysaccharide biosynthesis tyrosine autokinase [Pseudarthrobacter psychrotolerans]